MQCVFGVVTLQQCRRISLMLCYAENTNRRMGGGYRFIRDIYDTDYRCCHEMYFETRRCVKMRLRLLGELTALAQTLAGFGEGHRVGGMERATCCLLYTSDAADE